MNKNYQTLILKKNQILEKLKNVRHKDLEDLVHRRQLTYDEIRDILDLNYIPTKRTGYSLNPGVYEVSDINKTLKQILLDNVKVSVTIDDFRLKSNITTNPTLIFTEKSFLYNFSFYSNTFLSSRRYRWVLSIDCGIM